MKKRICVMLSACLLLSAFAGCGTAVDPNQNNPGTEPTEEAAMDHSAGIAALDGKKVIFIGNSHTYYSRCVINQQQSTVFQTRTGDEGIFCCRE